MFMVCYYEIIILVACLSGKLNMGGGVQLARNSSSRLDKGVKVKCSLHCLFGWSRNFGCLLK